MSERIFNFSPGPSMLPESVLKKAQAAIWNYNDSGMGVMELSHRGSHFEAIIKDTEQRLRKLLNISDDYAVLFCTGGATNQFSMVPMNLLAKGSVGNYILSGMFAEKAYEEAKKFGEIHVAASTKDKGYREVPTEIALSTNAAYLHFTSNNTIFGTQFAHEPDAHGAPLVCDASSDLLHKPLDISKYGLIYAGTQKNLGIAGATIVIIKRDLLARSADTLPAMMDYRTYAKNDSLYNTAPTFPIYVTGEVLKWIESEGGALGMEKRAWERASILYNFLDHCDFYAPYASHESRSLMNITFKLKDDKLEKQFVTEAESCGLNGLKGHRNVGGFRVSIYNAFPVEGIKTLVAFMGDFAKRNG